MANSDGKLDFTRPPLQALLLHELLELLAADETRVHVSLGIGDRDFR